MENGFFSQSKEELAEYGKAVGEIGRLRLIGIISRVLGMFLMILTIVLCALALFTFGAVALIDILAGYMPVWAAALIIGSTYIVLIAIAVACRKPLFIHPFIKMLSKQIKSEEELALKTLEAEHQAQLQQLRMQSNLLVRVWKAITRLLSSSH